MTKFLLRHCEEARRADEAISLRLLRCLWHLAMTEWKGSLAMTVLVLFVTLTLYAHAGERNYEKEKVVIPPGMELKKVGDVNLLYPKGASVDTGKPGYIYVGQEDIYAAKKFLEMEGRFNKIEEKEANLERALEDLKKRIDNIEGNIKEAEKPAKESPPREEPRASGEEALE